MDENISTKEAKSTQVQTTRYQYQENMAPTGEFVENSHGSLTRTDTSLKTNTQTRDLPPGHVVTTWFILINHPENCLFPAGGLPCSPPDVLANPLAQGSILIGSRGRLVNSNGVYTNTGRVAIGEPYGEVAHGPGLTNPRGALVLAGLRDHGPESLDPVVKESQYETHGGGCTVAPFPLPGGPGNGTYACEDPQTAIYAPPTP